MNSDAQENNNELVQSLTNKIKYGAAIAFTETLGNEQNLCDRQILKMRGSVDLLSCGVKLDCDITILYQAVKTDVGFQSRIFIHSIINSESGIPERDIFIVKLDKEFDQMNDRRQVSKDMYKMFIQSATYIKEFIDVNEVHNICYDETITDR